MFGLLDLTNATVPALRLESRKTLPQRSIVFPAEPPCHPGSHEPGHRRAVSSWVRFGEAPGLRSEALGADR